ncbi:MAG: ethanolamine ammonia-lyase subunit EutC [Azovibrio sp.]|nr:ethanolamine ammonia-lyase subunit EutC [Azovibrio sp.]
MGQLIVPDNWDQLRRHTRARIALGRAGVSLPTREVLNFSLAHAQARDAVHLPLDTTALAGELAHQGFHPLQVHSAAPDRAAYLRRPDWGRRLDEAGRATLLAARPVGESPALVILVADGLSALAVSRHAPPLLAALGAHLPDLAAAPLVIARQGRVALGDEVGELLGARLVVVLIGERPGLSSPDSLGIYLTWAPRVGCNDAGRNCISNVRPEGLSYAQAAWKLAYLINGARRLGCTGVRLKDDSDTPAALASP